MPQIDAPLILSGVKPRRRQRVEDAIAVVERCTDAGEIPNVVFKDIKGVVNDAFSDALGACFQEPYIYARRYEQYPEDIRFKLLDLSYPQCHTVNSFKKKVDAIIAIRNDFVGKDALVAFCQEAVRLGSAVHALREHVVKRQFAPAEEITDRYVPPPVSGEAARQVLNLLEEVSEEIYVSMKKERVDYRNMIVKQYNTDRAEYEAETGGNFDPISRYGYEFERGTTKPNPYYNPGVVAVISRLVERDSHTLNYSLAPNHEALIDELASKEASLVRNRFIYKNFGKLSSIVEAKGNLASGTMRVRSVQGGAIQGTLDFTFEDGSSFQARNSVVYSISVNGRPFERFPLTFHNAFLPDGSRMPAPDEQSMNEVFAHATAQTPSLQM